MPSSKDAIYESVSSNSSESGQDSCDAPENEEYHDDLTPQELEILQ